MASGRQIAACLILVLVALSIAACGGDSPQGPEIPADTAKTLNDKLDVIQSRLTSADKCGSSDTAQTSIDSLQGYVDQVAEQDIDPKIISDLRELIDNVDQRVAAECAASAETTDTTASQTESTSTTTETDTKSTTDKSTTTTDSTTEPTTSTTTTDPNEPQTPPDTQPGNPPPSNGGGNGNGGGGSQGGFEAGGTAPGGRVPATGGNR